MRSTWGEESPHALGLLPVADWERPKRQLPVLNRLKAWKPWSGFWPAQEKGLLVLDYSS